MESLIQNQPLSIMVTYTVIGKEVADSFDAHVLVPISVLNSMMRRPEDYRIMPMKFYFTGSDYEINWFDTDLSLHGFVTLKPTRLADVIH